MATISFFVNGGSDVEEETLLTCVLEDGWNAEAAPTKTKTRIEESFMVIYCLEVRQKWLDSVEQVLYFVRSNQGGESKL